MFTGIVESLVVLQRVESSGKNKHFFFSYHDTDSLYIDQSISHNGVCLTVTDIKNAEYSVTAIEETLIKTNMKHLKVGDHVNFERAALVNSRIDGHFVQGHVDKEVICTRIEEKAGSWMVFFNLEDGDDVYLVNKGSVCLNGVSLTVVDVSQNSFSVAIIPYTYEHTTFKFLKPGDRINIEFDILGKYMVNYLKKIHPPIG